jgi:hypothetical protein
MRGVVLPPRGSVRDEIYCELLRRERAEKASVIQFITMLFGRALNVPLPTIEGMLDLYLLELTQDRYKPEHVQQLRRQRAERRRKQSEDKSLLDKVARMSVTDKDLPPAKPTGRARRRR